MLPSAVTPFLEISLARLERMPEMPCFIHYLLKGTIPTRYPSQLIIS